MDVVTAISQQNMQVAAGQIGQQPVPKGQQFQLTINTLGRLTEPEQFADIILKAGSEHSPSQNPAGRRRRRVSSGRRQHSATSNASNGVARSRRPSAIVPACATSARVELGSQQYDQSCTLDGQPSVALSIYQLPGSNALNTADGVYAKMKELKTRFPDGLDYQIVYDTTPFIRESVNEVFNTLRDAIDPGRHRRARVLAGLASAMILPMIDVPVSLIGTFAVMAAHGLHASTT